MFNLRNSNIAHLFKAKGWATILLYLGLVAWSVVQASACTYSVSPSTLNFTSAGGSAPIVVQAPAGCPWFAQVAESFLTMRLAVSSAKPSGVIVGEGTQEVVVTITPNFTSRVGYIVIANHTLTVDQTGVTVPPVTPPTVPGNPPSTDCGATPAYNYRVWSNGVYQAGIYHEYPLEVENAGAVNLPNLYLVLAPEITPEWRALGSPRITYCYSSGGNYLIPIASVPPGEYSMTSVVTVYSTNPSVNPPNLTSNLGKVISGLPDR